MWVLALPGSPGRREVSGIGIRANSGKRQEGSHAQGDYNYLFAVSVFAGVVQAQCPLIWILRLRWERRTPAAAEGDQTRGFSRLMLGYETELSDLIDMRLR